MKNFILKSGNGSNRLCSVDNDIVFHCEDRKYLRVSSISENKTKLKKFAGKGGISGVIPVSLDNQFFYLKGRVYSLNTGKLIVKVEHKQAIEKWDCAFFTDKYLYAPIAPAVDNQVVKKDLLTSEEMLLNLGKKIYLQGNYYIGVDDTLVTCREINTDKVIWSTHIDSAIVEPGLLQAKLNDKYLVLTCRETKRVLILDAKMGEEMLYKYFSELLNRKIDGAPTPILYNDRLYFLGSHIDESGEYHKNALAYYSIPDKSIKYYALGKPLGRSFFVNKHGVFLSTYTDNPFVLNHDLDEIIYDPELRGHCSQIEGSDDFVLYGDPEGGALVIDCR